MEVVMKLIGVVSGHSYILLKDIFPRNQNINILRVPSFLFIQSIFILFSQARALSIITGINLLISSPGFTNTSNKTTIKEDGEHFKGRDFKWVDFDTFLKLRNK